MNFIPRIRERRMEKHMNQKQLAEKLQVDQNTVSKWETGRARPSLEYLYKMEAVLGCTLKDLFDVDTGSHEVE